MRSISERDLAVVIPLLAAKIREIRLELLAGEGRADEISDEDIEERTENQEILAAYEITLENLREEYEAGLMEGIQLPSFELLTKAFEINVLPEG